MIKCVQYTEAGKEIKQEGIDHIDIDEQFLDENGLYERNTFIAKCEQIDWIQPKIPTFNIAKQVEKQSNYHSGIMTEIQFGCNFIEEDDSLIEPRNYVTVEYNPMEITKEQKPTDSNLLNENNYSTLIPWTPQQKNLAENFFSRHIKEKLPPRKREVIELQEKYPEIFSNETWPVIKVYICNKFRDAEEKSSRKDKRHDDIRSNLNSHEKENRPNEPRNDFIEERNLLGITTEQKPTATDLNLMKYNERTLIPWTTQQKELAENFFSRHIQEKIPPKKMEVVELQEKYPEIFSNKRWPVIKVYICNKFRDAEKKSSPKDKRHDDIKSNLNFHEKENRLNERKNDVIEELNLLEITTEQKPSTDLNLMKYNKRTLIPWTIQQKELAENFFSRHIREKIPPKKMEVVELQEKYPEIFFNKTWPVIKVYICNKFRDAEEKSSHKNKRHDDNRSNLNFHEKDNRLNEQKNDVIEELNLLEITTEQKPSTDLNLMKYNKRTLIPWTTQQKELAENFFSRHIQEKIPPKKMEVVKLQEKYPEIFSNKTWPVIKVYICNKFRDVTKNDVTVECNPIEITKEQKPTSDSNLINNKQRNKRTLIPWTTQQKNLAVKFFRKHIKEKIPPQKKEVLELKEKYPEIFSNKTWPVIKVYICNKFKDAEDDWM